MNFLRHLLRLRRYKRKSVEVAVSRKGVGQFERRFQREGASPTNHCWYQSSKVIALWCGIQISVVRHLVLSQSTRVTDGRTDRITTPKTALAYARVVKTKKSLFEPPFFTRTPSMAHWKAVVDFIFVVIELFRCLLRLRRYERKSVEVGVFRRGGGGSL